MTELACGRKGCCNPDDYFDGGDVANDSLVAIWINLHGKLVLVMVKRYEIPGL